MSSTTITIGALAGDGSPETLKYGDVWFDRRETTEALLVMLAESRTKTAKLLVAMSWVDQPFVNENTSREELWSRIKFMLADRDMVHNANEPQNREPPAPAQHADGRGVREVSTPGRGGRRGGDEIRGG